METLLLGMLGNLETVKGKGHQKLFNVQKNH
jgi:hypothetical protein